MKATSALTLFLALACAGTASAQQKVFEWQPANDESVRLDPANYHTGRTYHPGPQGGSLHVDIVSQRPVTIFMTSEEAWNRALQYPESIDNLRYTCLREHVVKTTYLCDMPAEPMTLVIRDERNSPDSAVFAGLGAVLRPDSRIDRAVGVGIATVLTGHDSATRRFVSPNDVHIQYYRWACISNCFPPEFQWILQAKEKYELTSFLKVYGGYTPERDGEVISIKIKAPAPMLVAVLPSAIANQLHSKPDMLEPALEKNSCQQRGVQSQTFQCTFNASDGPQSLIVVPEATGKIPHKKAEVEFFASKCVANCALPPDLQKGVLKKLTLGQSFAEYDQLLERDNVYVETPALRAASDGGQGKCFFVGRRGTGKTAITLYLQRKFPGRVVLLLPQLLVPVGRYFSVEMMQDVHHQPFKSLVSSFKRAMLDEVLRYWIQRGIFSYRSNSPAPLSRERNYVEDYDFDISLLEFAEETLEAFSKNQDKDWLRYINRWKDLAEAMDAFPRAAPEKTLLLIDRVDESWDGSDKSVILLMAMMHACVELSSACECMRPLLFLRENVFERVRLVDKEFARLETFVTSLEWTKEQLVELVERRLNVPLIAKYALRGDTWKAFFEDGAERSSQDIVFGSCQYRPRDVLIYCSLAIEIAQSKLRERVLIDDLLSAKRRFSDSRLKDLSDEYADNFPQLQLVLGRFFGLGSEFTVKAIDDFLKKLLVDEEIKRSCASWIFNYTQPDMFIQLLFNIGFAGIKDENIPYYRSSGSQSTTPPAIGTASILVIHPAYRESLNLRDVLLTSLDPSVPLTESGLLPELPQGINIEDYTQRLRELREELRTMPTGEHHAEDFANITGEIIRLTLFRALTNIESKVRNLDGRVIRDWIAANHSHDGFWEVIRQKYGAVQVVFECKNYADVEASDFHQVAYYMNDTIGRFAVLVFRGTELKRHYFEHIRRIATEKRGMVVLFTDRDLDILLRQGINGKSSEAHLQELYDRCVREVS